MGELALRFFSTPLHDVEAADCFQLCIPPSTSKVETQDKYTWKYIESILLPNYKHYLLLRIYKVSNAFKPMMNEVWVILVPYHNLTSDREEAIIFFFS